VIILARHGNTFESGQPAVWVGARTDLPLTGEGVAQAERVAAYLKAQDIAPRTVVAGPLMRTRQFAAIVANAFDRQVAIDSDLVELDYGGWEGKTSDMIAAEFGRESLDGWEQRLEWPKLAGWGEGRAKVEERLNAFLSKVRSSAEPVFACTSNGILRLIRHIVDGTAGSAGRVRTGAICVLDRRPTSELVVNSWDKRP
jgi:broad specificity phosphatase PhoE